MTEHVTIEIENPKVAAGMTVTGQSIPIGDPGDYKPCIARMPSGQLLLVAFRSKPSEGTKKVWSDFQKVLVDVPSLSEEIIMFRSDDDGRSWSDAENMTLRKGLIGREPYFTILSDRTIFLTTHLLAQDVNSDSSFIQTYIHRSTDDGNAWETVQVEAEPDGSTLYLRNILELYDGSLLFGVSNWGSDASYFYRSYDRGRTWSQNCKAKIMGLDPAYPSPVLAEAVAWQARSGAIYFVNRMDYRFVNQMENDVTQPEEYFDHYDRLILYKSTDEGRTLDLIGPIADFGEMYPAFLRLTDGRLLFTFTVRALKTPLGVRAVLATENTDGFEIDTKHDRFLLDTETPPGVTSGGGFGPTLQLADETLVTSYSYRDVKQTTHMEIIRWRV